MAQMKFWDGAQWVTIAQVAEGGGGGASWSLYTDKDGTSATGLTTIAGTWSSDGTVIKNTDTGASRMAYFGSLLDVQVPILVEVECRIPTNTGGDQYVGMHMINGASGAAFLGPRVAFISGAWRAHLATTGANAIDVADAGGGFGTWRKIRLLGDGAVGSMWLDGALIGSVASNTNNASLGGVALFSYGASVEYRNYKLWRRADLPA